MTDVRIRWDGFDELKAMLLSLPEDLAEEAEGIVLDAADRARDDVDAEYAKHERTGSLRAGLKVVSQIRGGWAFSVGSKKLGAGAVLYNNAPLAYIFENGSRARHNGIRATGSMPAGHAFIPHAIRRRREMYQALAAMLAAHGLTVTGRAA